MAKINLKIKIDKKGKTRTDYKTEGNGIGSNSNMEGKIAEDLAYTSGGETSRMIKELYKGNFKYQLDD